MPKELATLAEFEEAIKGDKVIVDFWATWCPPCQMIGPKYAAISEMDEYKGITFCKVDVDNNGEAAQAAGISCMPTFKVYKNGTEVDKLEGASEQGIKDMCAKLV